MKKEQTKMMEILDVTHSIAANYLGEYEYPWEVLPHIGEIILQIGETLPEKNYKKVGDNIWIHKSVHVPPTCAMAGPIIICNKAEIRPGAFLRGNIIVGAEAVVGNSTELKNAILFDRVQVPHYNYVGDSILGYKSHMGASSLTSNVKSDKTPVMVHTEEGDIETGLKKFGAIIGDYVDIGCGTVLNPGTMIGKRTNIYPLCSVRGCVNSNSIYKAQGDVVVKEDRKIKSLY